MAAPQGPLSTMLVGKPRVIPVTDNVRVASGFHLGNTIRIDTPEGMVAVDTRGGVPNASIAPRTMIS